MTKIFYIYLCLKNCTLYPFSDATYNLIFVPQKGTSILSQPLRVDMTKQQEERPCPHL